MPNKEEKKFNKDLKIQNKKIFGYIPSPEDKRDYSLQTVGVCTATVIPEEYMPEKTTPILNQGSVGSCVAHALATTMAYGELHSARGVSTNWSRGFIYGNRALLDYSGEGMIARQALKQLQKEGDCVYNTFPWNEKYPSVKSRIEVHEDKYHTEAKKYTIKSYFRCYDETEIKTTIMKQGAVLLCMPTYSTFQKNVPLPEPNDKSTGGHAMCCVGWNKDGWIVQNSWGSYWGDKGFCYVPYEYPVREWWGIILDDSLEPPPSTNFFTRIWQCICALFKNLFK